MSEILSEVDVQEAFLAAPPAIQQQILNLTIKIPNWYRDIFQPEEWPAGVPGTELEQIIMRGEMPEIEEGFDKWTALSNNTGCNPCEGPNCSYNWTTFGGNGFERKKVVFGTRDFRSPSYCVKEIQTTYQFEQVFAQIVANLNAQIQFFKEMNIGRNGLVSLSKKFVVDSDGAKPNLSNIYTYPNIGTAKLSTLNIYMLEFFYEYMRRMTEAEPYDIVNGSPVFALSCSHQLLARLYLDDPNLRQDVRFSGLANDMLMKYNFMSTIRGMFIAAPTLWPRRFNIVNGEPVQVLPFEKGIPMEVGSFTGFNPLFEQATHEEVLIYGKYPFKVMYKPTVSSLGGNTSFGPEVSFLNNWQWANPQTQEDLMRRVGMFVSSATIAIVPQYSDALFGILVARPQVKLMATFLPDPPCPPTPSDCDNAIPATGCPCPAILTVTANPITAGRYYVQLTVPTAAVASDVIQLGINSGGYVNATIVAKSSDSKTLDVTIANFTNPNCDIFTSVFCDNTLGCFSDVLRYSVDCTDATRLYLTLANPIKAVTAAQVVTLYYGNGTTQSATIVDVNQGTGVWHVDIGGTAFCDQVGGIVGICVPTATDGTCGACNNAPTITQCAT